MDTFPFSELEMGRAILHGVRILITSNLDIYLRKTQMITSQYTQSMRVFSNNVVSCTCTPHEHLHFMEVCVGYIPFNVCIAKASPWHIVSIDCYIFYIPPFGVTTTR